MDNQSYRLFREPEQSKVASDAPLDRHVALSEFPEELF